MGNDSNKKSLRATNKKGKEVLEAENVKVSTGTKESDKSVYTTGAAAFADFFDKIAEEANRKAQKELEKPKYRFVSSGLEKYPSDDVVNEISDLKEQLKKIGFEVEIIENIDIKDVTKEKRYLIRVSSFNGIYTEIDLLEYRELIKQFDFSPEDFFQKEIAKITGSIDEVTREAAFLVVDLLSYMIYFRVLYTLKYDRIGWYEYDWDKKTYIFKYDNIITKLPFVKGKGSQKDIDGLSKSENPNGEIEWVNAAVDLLNNHVMDCVILGAAASGIIRGYLPYTKETNININIQGDPACGKSTICHFALSMFGNPEKLEGSFTDTDNSMEEIRVRRPVLPYVLDERMLKSNGEEKNKSATLITDIFREYEGKVKERLGKQYEETSGERTFGPIISSSVEKMMDVVMLSAKDLGQYRRFMEFCIDDKKENRLFDDADEAKKIEKIAYSHYGFGVRIFVDYMLELITYGFAENQIDDSIKAQDDVIQAEFHYLDAKIHERLEEEEIKEGIVGLTSSSKRFALIVYSYQMLRDALLYYYCLKDERERKEDLNKQIEERMNNKQIKEMINAAAQSSEAKDFAASIQEYMKKVCKSELDDDEQKNKIREAKVQINNDITAVISDIHLLSMEYTQKKIAAIIKSFYDKCVQLNCVSDTYNQNEVQACEEKVQVAFKQLYIHIVEKDVDIKENILSGVRLQEKRINENLIEDKTAEIIDLLVKNLVIKMRDVKNRTLPKYLIYDYFIKNKKYFYECKSYKESWESNSPYAYIGKYINRANGIELILDTRLDIPEILFSQKISESEDILKYMEQKNVLNGIKKPTKELKDSLEAQKKKLHAVSNDEIKRYCKYYNILEKSLTSTVFYNGDTVGRAVSYLLPIEKSVMNEPEEKKKDTKKAD